MDHNGKMRLMQIRNVELVNRASKKYVIAPAEWTIAMAVIRVVIGKVRYGGNRRDLGPVLGGCGINQFTRLTQLSGKIPRHDEATPTAFCRHVITMREGVCAPSSYSFARYCA